MTIIRRERKADSPLVERITYVTYDDWTKDLTTPDGCWDIVVLQRCGVTTVLQTGLISRPVTLQNGPGDSYLAISFKPGVFAPKTPGIQMIDRALVRPLVSSRAFAMETHALEVPTFENADQLVDRLVRRGLLARDEIVTNAVEGRPQAVTVRSMQRHFLSTLGITPSQFSQIKRACHAVELLRQGLSPAVVAATAGYSDQPHLTRSLKAIMGHTPGAFVREMDRDAPRTFEDRAARP